MSAQKTLVSARELLNISADGKRCELLKGELIELAPTGRLHGRIAATVAYLLLAHVRNRDLGEVSGSRNGVHHRQRP